MMFGCNANYAPGWSSIRVYRVYMHINVDIEGASVQSVRIIYITSRTGWGSIMNRENAKANQLKREGTCHPRPEKVRADLVAQSPFFDANDLVQMKYEMLRSVSAEQKPVAEAARMFGLSRVAYYHAREQYEDQGLAGLLPRRRGPKHPHKFSAEVMVFINEQMAAAGGPPNWSLIAEQIETRFGIQVHPRSVERAVKRKKNPTQ